MLNDIIYSLGFLYLGVCVVVGVSYAILYGFWSAYLTLKGDGDKAMQLEGSDIKSYFIFLLGNLIIKMIKLHRKFRHYVEMRRRKKLKKAISRLSH
ncbi:MAG: hypothetical protein Q8T08_21925 [Ignavibacteria bacterium]|nr:hypothetical protein [Ignavibacteria bacterium]